MLTKETIILIFVELLGVGLQMTESKLIGLCLILVSSLCLWYLLLPQLSDKLETTMSRPPHYLWGGWIGIVVLCVVYGWWIHGSSSAETLPPQVSSTNQSGGITAHTVTIDKFITVMSTPTPQITLGEIVQPSTKTEDGYQTTVRLHVLSPFPVGNLFLAVHGKNIKGIRISPERTGMFATGHTGVREGYAFTNVPNAYGNLRLTITSSEPLGPTNTVQVDSRIE